MSAKKTPIEKAPAARFKISIDGVPRSHRDQRDMASEAAAQLMLKYPDSAVAVRNRGPSIASVF